MFSSVNQTVELDPTYAQFRDQTRFWVQRVGVPMLMVIGLFGNLITIIIMTRRRMRSTTNMYLAALAFVDMLYSILTFLLSLSHYPNTSSPHYYTYWKLRPFLMMLTDACSNTSVWLTVTFTIERYIAVRYPMKGKVWCTEARAKRLIIGVFAFGILSASPVPFEWKVVERRAATCVTREMNQLKLQQDELPLLNDNVQDPKRDGKSTATIAALSNPLERLLSYNNRTAASTNSLNSQGDERQKVEPSGSCLPRMTLDYSDFGRNETYKTIYYRCTAIIFYFIPLFSLMLFNGFLIKSVHESKRERTKMTTRQEKWPTTCSNATQSTLLATGRDSLINGNTKDAARSLGAKGKISNSDRIINDARAGNKYKGRQKERKLNSNSLDASRQSPEAITTEFESCRLSFNGIDCSDSLVCSQKGDNSSVTTTELLNNVPSIEISFNESPLDREDARQTSSVQLNCDNKFINNGNANELNHVLEGSSCSHKLVEVAFPAQKSDIGGDAVSLDNKSQQSQSRRSSTSPPNTSYTNQNSLQNTSIVPASSQERRITIMLIAVVILFLICQIPSAAMLLYTSVHETTPNTNGHAIELGLGNIFNFLMGVNSAGNFILYSFLSKKYRKTFMIIFCRCLLPMLRNAPAGGVGNRINKPRKEVSNQNLARKNTATTISGADHCTVSHRLNINIERDTLV